MPNATQISVRKNEHSTSICELHNLYSSITIFIIFQAFRLVQFEIGIELSGSSCLLFLCVDDTVTFLYSFRNLHLLNLTILQQDFHGSDGTQLPTLAHSQSTMATVTQSKSALTDELETLASIFGDNFTLDKDRRKLFTISHRSTSSNLTFQISITIRSMAPLSLSTNLTSSSTQNHVKTLNSKIRVHTSQFQERTDDPSLFELIEKLKQIIDEHVEGTQLLCAPYTQYTPYIRSTHIVFSCFQLDLKWSTSSTHMYRRVKKRKAIQSTKTTNQIPIGNSFLRSYE